MDAEHRPDERVDQREDQRDTAAAAGPSPAPPPCPLLGPSKRDAVEQPGWRRPGRRRTRATTSRSPCRHVVAWQRRATVAATLAGVVTIGGTGVMVLASLAAGVVAGLARAGLSAPARRGHGGRVSGLLLDGRRDRAPHPGARRRAGIGIVPAESAQRVLLVGLRRPVAATAFEIRSASTSGPSTSLSSCRPACSWVLAVGASVARAGCSAPLGLVAAGGLYSLGIEMVQLELARHRPCVRRHRHGRQRPRRGDRLRASGWCCWRSLRPWRADRPAR